MKQGRQTHVTLERCRESPRSPLSRNVHQSVCPLQSDRLAEYLICCHDQFSSSKNTANCVDRRWNVVLTQHPLHPRCPRTHTRTPSPIDRELPPPLHLPFFPSFLPSFLLPACLYGALRLPSPVSHQALYSRDRRSQEITGDQETGTTHDNQPGPTSQLAKNC